MGEDDPAVLPNEPDDGLAGVARKPAREHEGFDSVVVLRRPERLHRDVGRRHGDRGENRLSRGDRGDKVREAAPDDVHRGSLGAPGHGRTYLIAPEAFESVTTHRL